MWSVASDYKVFDKEINLTNWLLLNVKKMWELNIQMFGPFLVFLKSYFTNIVRLLDSSISNLSLFVLQVFLSSFKTFVIAIGEDVHKNNLHALVQSDKNVFHAPTYDQLNSDAFITSISQKTCGIVGRFFYDVRCL